MVESGSAELSKAVKLNNGVEMPTIGLGCDKLLDPVKHRQAF